MPATGYPVLDAALSADRPTDLQVAFIRSHPAMDDMCGHRDEDGWCQNAAVSFERCTDHLDRSEVAALSDGDDDGDWWL